MADELKVFFKRGSQTNLSKLTSAQIEAGTFYLTEDTHRLYVGQNSGSANELVLLNQTVQFVKSINELTTMSNGWTEAQKAAHVHDIYYIVPNDVAADQGSGAVGGSYGNILAVWEYSESQGYRWVQINPNTNTTNDSFIASVTASGNKAEIKHTVTDSESNSVQAGFSISAGKNNNVDTVKIESNNDAANPGLVITGDTYALTLEGATMGDGAKAAKIILTSALGQAASNVYVVAGENVSIEEDASGNIVISSDKWLPTNESSYITNTNGVLSVYFSDGTDTVVAQSQQLTVSVGKDTKTPVAIGGDLGVYSIAEVDKLFRDLNGMTFRGNIAAKDSGKATYEIDANGIYKDGAAASVQNGDMFLVSGAISTGSVTAGTGDLIIASGTESTSDGYIISGLTWSVVPAGDDIHENTEYQFVANNADNSLTLYAMNDAGSKTGAIKLVDGTAIDVVSETDGTNTLVATINHADINPTVAEVSAGTVSESDHVFSITSIGSIEVNKQGHVTKVEPKTFTLPAYSTSLGVKNESGNGLTKATITSYLSVNGEAIESETETISFTSSTLKVNADANSKVINTELVWGTF